MALAGDDTFRGGQSSSRFDGGLDFDTFTLADPNLALVVDLVAGTAATGGAVLDTVAGIEAFIGGNLADAFTGDGNANQFLGLGGNDTMDGGDGNDTLLGGINNDSLAGRNGNDSIQGDAGNDFLSGGTGNDTLHGGGGNDRIVGGLQNDRIITGSGIDTVVFAARFATDTVTDFANGIDRLDFGTTDAASTQAIIDIAQQVGNNVVIDFQNGFNDKLILQKFVLADLDLGDFVF